MSLFIVLLHVCFVLCLLHVAFSVETSTQPSNPCEPSPCGPHSICRVRNNVASCSCLQDYIGTPPNCRPECTTNSDCSPYTACVRQKCVDPCPGVCGERAECSVSNHNPLCTCPPGYHGDPFRRCTPIPSSK